MVKKRIVKYLQHEQVMKIFEKIPVQDERYLLAFRLMYECLMRVSEVCNLRVRDLNFQDSLINIIDSKSGDRIIPLTNELASLLERFVKDKPLNAYVFTKKSGRQFTRQHLDFKLKLYSSYAGITEETLGFKPSCHKLRHSGAREYLRRKVLDIEDIRKILGHRHLSTTSIYLATLPFETKEKLLSSGGLCKNKML